MNNYCVIYFLNFTSRLRRNLVSYPKRNSQPLEPIQFCLFQTLLPTKCGGWIEFLSWTNTILLTPKSVTLQFRAKVTILLFKAQKEEYSECLSLLRCGLRIHHNWSTQYLWISQLEGPMCSFFFHSELLHLREGHKFGCRVMI